mmetsp:Transcript_25726/g.43165  ORF Transcript_25726/g.43165 Transcript_25726/m.43165 type:complete len:84 (+) Transcript_25726:474-725(+)
MSSTVVHTLYLSFDDEMYSLDECMCVEELVVIIPYCSSLTGYCGCRCQDLAGGANEKMVIILAPLFLSLSLSLSFARSLSLRY